MEKYSIGIDFGTLSARAILVNLADGRVCAQSEFTYPHGVMELSLPDGTPLEKSSAYQHPQDYLDALSHTVRDVVATAHVAPENILSLGIDFTACTVLPTAEDGTPLCFFEEFSSEPHAYVKLWKHHSAQAEADFITELAIKNGQSWLNSYGGKVSSEWLFPKALETLNKAPAVFDRAARFTEAADWLVLLLTGEESHSSCMAGYKGMWNAEDGYPSSDFLEKIHPKFKNIVGTKISEKILPTGSKAGEINSYGSRITGLAEGTAVSVPIIDAHAALPSAGIVQDGTLMAIIGTSTCHIIMDKQAKNVPGICGSVRDGVIPGYVAYEAGQAAVGDIFSWFVKTFVPESYIISAKEQNVSVFDLLNTLAKDLPIDPDGVIALDWWNGNRTPYADAGLKGMLCGLTLNTRPEEIYKALIEATAFGTKRIVDLYVKNGVAVNEIYASGGIPQKNAYLVQLYADVMGLPVKVPGGIQAGAKGSAILAAYACGYYQSFEAAANAMADKSAVLYQPNFENTKKYSVLYEKYCRLSEFFAKEL